MIEPVLWLSILAAASVGFGLGWWWFSGPSPTGTPETGSASVARRRAAPDAQGSASAVDPAEHDALRTMLHSARSELTTLREAMEHARTAQAAAHHEVHAGRNRLTNLQASLDQTRTDRDTLRAEVDRAHRAIRQLEAPISSPNPNPTPAPTPADLFRIEVDANERDAAPPTGSAVVPSPDTPPESHAPRPPEESAATDPALDSLADLSQLPHPGLTLPAPPPRRPRSPVDVLFGPLGGVPLTTTARSIPWELTVRLRESPEASMSLTGVTVTLRFDLEDEGLSINSRRRGPLPLCSGASITSTRPLNIQVSLSTGVHSDTPEADRPPAVPGKHRVIIAVQYRPERSQDTPTTVRFSAHIPVIPAPI